MIGEGMLYSLKIMERNHACRFNISKGYRNIFDDLKTEEI
jgi:hypothetical protein